MNFLDFAIAHLAFLAGRGEKTLMIEEVLRLASQLPPLLKKDRMNFKLMKLQHCDFLYLAVTASPFPSKADTLSWITIGSLKYFVQSCRMMQ